MPIQIRRAAVEKRMASTAKKIKDEEKPAEMSVVKNETVETPAPPVAEQPKPPVLTLQEKIQKVEDLGILVEKRNQLLASLREISQFKLSSDSMSNRVSIRNAATQREFNTSNSEVISEIIDVVIRKIEGKLAEVETMITF